MRYITFNEGIHNSWRPRILNNILISDIKTLRNNLVNSTGFLFRKCRGVISDEDAILVKLRGGNFKIEEI